MRKNNTCASDIATANSPVTAVDSIGAQTSSAARAAVTGNSLLNEDQTAALLGVSPRTLQGWRVRGGGPRFIALGAGGRVVRYRQSDLEAYIEQRARVSTSDSGAAA